jgi:hypothetical protein
MAIFSSAIRETTAFARSVSPNRKTKKGHTAHYLACALTLLRGLPRGRRLASRPRREAALEVQAASPNGRGRRRHSRRVSTSDLSVASSTRQGGIVASARGDSERKCTVSRFPGSFAYRWSFFVRQSATSFCNSSHFSLVRSLTTCDQFPESSLKFTTTRLS